MHREPNPRCGALPRTAAWRFALPALAVAAVMAAATAVAQGVRPAPAAAVPVREEGVRWHSLSPAQREMLAPLERDWSSIDAPRKQKWLTLATRMKTLPPEERARIDARMSEWARLSPAERGQARLRFEEARQVPATDRSARWKEYQALPPEQRAQFAARAGHAAPAPSGSDAVRVPRSPVHDSKEAKSNLVPNPTLVQAPRSVAPTLVQAAPGATTTLITRRPTPPLHQHTGMPKIAATPEFVHSSTLLPKRGPQAAAVVPVTAPMGANHPLAPAPPKRPASAPR